MGLGAYHLPIPIPKLQIHTLVVRSVLPRKGAIYMVPRPKLGWQIHFLFFASVHSIKEYSPLWKVHCAYSVDSTGDKEFDSNVSYFLILIKACSILVCTHFTLVLLSFLPRLVISGKISMLHSGQSISKFIPWTHNLCHCLWWALSTFTVCLRSTKVHLGPQLESWPT